MHPAIQSVRGGVGGGGIECESNTRQFIKKRVPRLQMGMPGYLTSPTCLALGRCVSNETWFIQLCAQIFDLAPQILSAWDILEMRIRDY